MTTQRGALRDYILNIQPGAQELVQAVGNYFNVTSADGARVNISTSKGDSFDVQEGQGARVRDFESLRVRNDGSVPIRVVMIAGSGDFQSVRTVGAVSPIAAGTLQGLAAITGSGTIAANPDRRELVMVADIANADPVSIEGLPLQPGDVFTLEVTGAVTVTANSGNTLHVAEVI